MMQAKQPRQNEHQHGERELQRAAKEECIQRCPSKHKIDGDEQPEDNRTTHLISICDITVQCRTASLPFGLLL